MFKKIKSILMIAALTMSFGAPVLAPAIASAVVKNGITENLCTGVNNAAGGSTTGGCDSATANDSLKTIAGQIVNVFSIIVGIAAVIMIIVGGFRYITSGGDSNNVSGAKNTLIYAIVGLIVVALAQFIVHYVLSTATNSVT